MLRERREKPEVTMEDVQDAKIWLAATADVSREVEKNENKAKAAEHALWVISHLLERVNGK